MPDLLSAPCTKWFMSKSILYHNDQADLPIYSLMFHVYNCIIVLEEFGVVVTNYVIVLLINLDRSFQSRIQLYALLRQQCNGTGLSANMISYSSTVLLISCLYSMQFRVKLMCLYVFSRVIQCNLLLLFRRIIDVYVKVMDLYNKWRTFLLKSVDYVHWHDRTVRWCIALAEDVLYCKRRKNYTIKTCFG